MQRAILFCSLVAVALAGSNYYDFDDPNEIPDERPKFKIETDYASK